MRIRRLSTVLATCALAMGSVAAPAFAWCEEENNTEVHCNSGNGNGSDPITFVPGERCYGADPGNAYNAGNKGGDEIPTSDGVPNPGGNNVP